MKKILSGKSNIVNADLLVQLQNQQDANFQLNNEITALNIQITGFRNASETLRNDLSRSVETAEQSITMRNKLELDCINERNKRGELEVEARELQCQLSHTKDELSQILPKVGVLNASCQSYKERYCSLFSFHVASNPSLLFSIFVLVLLVLSNSN